LVNCLLDSKTRWTQWEVFMVRKAFGAAVLALVLSASPAAADVVFTPFLGPTFGGQTLDERLNFGASLGIQGDGVLGFEVDFGHSPNFFGRFPFGTFDGGRVTTFAGNLILGSPLGVGGVSPYATAGLGLMRLHVNGAAALTRTDAVANIGAGLTGLVSENVGLRADVRYFRNFDRIEELNLGHFDFWRGTVGITFRLGR
jgi:opacity protein-like surface antigen